MWFVRVLALLGAGLCGYLVYLKWSGSVSGIQGCGDPGGCDLVLGGEWSQWMGVPVSGLALGLYVAVFLLTFRVFHEILGYSADVMLCAAALMVVLSAGWFGGLLVKKGAFCPFCLGAHGIGLLFASALLISAFRQRKETGRGVLSAAGFMAVAAFVLLILGQAFGPKPPPMVLRSVALKDGMQTEVLSTKRPEGIVLTSRKVSFFGGSFHFDLDHLPMMGDRTAKRVLVEYFDYTCNSCRQMHGQLKKVVEENPATYAVVVLPTPLNRACNAHLGTSVNDHAGACEAARISLIVWRAAPEKFEKFHHYLMTEPLPLDLVEVEARARAEVSTVAFEGASADPWVDARILADTADYGAITKADGSPKMPKLLLHDSQLLSGVGRNEVELLKQLEGAFGGSDR